MRLAFAETDSDRSDMCVSLFPLRKSRACDRSVVSAIFSDFPAKGLAKRDFFYYNIRFIAVHKIIVKGFYYSRSVD